MTAEGIAGFDHVSLPMRDAEAMLAFYRALGCEISEQRSIVSVHLGAQMINFHRPELWPNEKFTLRAPAAVPPCGDLCFVWNGSAPALHELLASAGVAIEEGPVTRRGARGVDATSVYTRDPDGNLLEFMIYGS